VALSRHKNYCDELVSLPKSVLTQYVGSLKSAALDQLNQALMVSLALEEPTITHDR